MWYGTENIWNLKAEMYAVMENCVFRAVGETNLGHGGLQCEAADVWVSGVGGSECDCQVWVWLSLTT